MKKLSICNETDKVVQCYYNTFPNKSLREITLQPLEKKTIDIEAIRYCVGVKLNDKIMIPRGFFTSTEIFITQIREQTYWSINFDQEPSIDDILDDKIPEELNLYFAKWVANRYDSNPKIKKLYLEEPSYDQQKNLALIISDDYSSTGYYQIPGKYFASCFLKFQCEELTSENVEALSNLHKKSLDYRTLVLPVDVYQNSSVKSKYLLKM